MPDIANLTNREKNIINSSWRIMREEGVANHMFFYEALFRFAPETKQYFRTNDFKQLSRKFDRTMTFLVDNIFRLEKITPEIEDLGSIHKKLDIDSKYYSLFNQALLSLLDDTLQEKNSDEIKIAWTKMLSYVTEIMKSAPIKKVNKLQQWLDSLFGKTKHSH